MKRPVLTISVLILLVLVAFGSYQAWHVNNAHKTFDNYYAFRGCTKLLDRTDTYADCQLANGQTIKIVEVNNEWYLDGDLPCPGPKFSLSYIMCVI